MTETNPEPPLAADPPEPPGQTAEAPDLPPADTLDDADIPDSSAESTEAATVEAPD
jgi:hypothetical protein